LFEEYVLSTEIFGF